MVVLDLFGILILVGLIVLVISKITERRTSADFRSNKDKAKEIKSLKNTIRYSKMRERLAIDALSTITADYTHNPQLEARLCLDKMRDLEIKELTENE